MKKLFVFVFTAVTLLSCSDDDSDNNGNLGLPTVSSSVPVYQNLKVEYNDTKKQTDVSANFLKSNAEGAYISLSAPSSVMFNNQQPSFSTDEPYLYTSTFSGEKEVTFTLTRRQGEVYTNTVTPDEYAFPEIVGLDAISLQSGTFFVWMGKAVGEGEMVEVRIKTDAQEYTFQATEAGSIGVEIKFPSTAKAGEAEFYVSRIQTKDLQQDDKGAGGEITVVYTNEQEITLD